jgi:hypothetical protein
VELSEWDKGHALKYVRRESISPFPGWADKTEGYFAMLTAAFDASGDDGTPIVSVAGFISSVKDWEDFSKLWTARLARENIKYFRAVEAAHFSKEFKPWRDWPNEDKESWRQALFTDLMEIIKSHVYRYFGCSIVNSALGEMNEDFKKEFYLTAYSIAGRTCEKRVRHWILDEWKNSTVNVELVFEMGDDETELRKRLSHDHCLPPIFRPKLGMVDDKGVFHPGFVPLQAADWLAYELSIATRDLTSETKHIESTADLRWPLRQFCRIQGTPGVFATDDIKGFEKNIELYKHLKNWWASIGA